MCKLHTINSDEDFLYEDFRGTHFTYIITQTFCVSKMVFTLTFSTNIPEAYFYYKIFKKMKRYLTQDYDLKFLLSTLPIISPPLNDSYINLIYINSQVEPSDSNVAANSLPRDIQLRNVRKAKVNANVYLVLYILEWVGNGSSYIVHIYWKHYFLDMFLFWYYVTLPYVHLMNTSDNKELVVDNGLTNVLRNAFVTPFKIMKANFFSGRNSEGQENKSSHEMSNTKRKIVLSNDNYKNTEVFLISKPNFSSVPLKTKKSLSSNASNNAPCNSSGLYKTTTLTNHTQLARQSQLEPDLEDNDLSFEAEHLSNSKIILLHMMDNINNEEQYLHYFMQLIDYEDTVKAGDKINFVIMHNVQSKHVLSKNTKRKNTLNSEGPNSKKSYVSLPNVSPEIVELKNKLSGTFLDRMEMRRIILQNFIVNCNDEESYNIYLTELIDFEEKLTKY